MVLPLVFLAILLIIVPGLLGLIAYLGKGTASKTAALRLGLHSTSEFLLILGVGLLLGADRYWGLDSLVGTMAANLPLQASFVMRLPALIKLSALVLFAIAVGIMSKFWIDRFLRGSRASFGRSFAVLFPPMVLLALQLVMIGVTYFFFQSLFRPWLLKTIAFAIAVGVILMIFNGMKRGVLRLVFRRNRVDAEDEPEFFKQIAETFGFDPHSLIILDTEDFGDAAAWVRGSVHPRIFLTSVLWRALPQNEQVAVVGQEIGHIRGRSVRKTSLVVTLALTLAAWLFFGVFHGLIPPGPYRDVVFFTSLIITYLVIVVWIPGLMRRRWEYDADLWAVRAMGESDTLASALEHIQELNHLPASRIQARLRKLRSWVDRRDTPTMAADAAYRSAADGDATRAAIDAYRDAQDKDS